MINDQKTPEAGKKSDVSSGTEVEVRSKKVTPPKINFREHFFAGLGVEWYRVSMTAPADV